MRVYYTKLHKEGLLDHFTYCDLHLSSSRPGILYGLPKIHKEMRPIIHITPMRPILSAIGTSGYKLSKFIIKFLTPLTSNEFTLKDSFAFVNEICVIPNDQNYIMASFDVKSSSPTFPSMKRSTLLVIPFLILTDSLTLSSLKITSNNFWNWLPKELSFSSITNCIHKKMVSPWEAH